MDILVSTKWYKCHDLLGKCFSEVTPFNNQCVGNTLGRVEKVTSSLIIAFH